MAHPAGPRSFGGSLMLGRMAALATTLLAVATAIGTLPEDPLRAFERVLPTWLIGLEVAGAISIVAAAWITSASRPSVTLALLVTAIGLMVPVWAGWAWLPAALRAAAVAAAPLAVAGAGHVGLGWTEGGRRTRTLMLVDLLALSAVGMLALGYDPIADPGCVRTCLHVDAPFSSSVSTRAAFAIATSLTLVSAGIAAYGLVRAMSMAGRGIVAGAALAAIAGLAASWILWVAFWGRMVPPVVLVAPAIVSAAILGVGTLAGGLAIGRTRAAAGRLAARLQDPDPFAREPGGHVQEVQFAVPGEGRWVDAAGHPVEMVPAVGRPVVISDRDGPVVRLVVRRDDEPSDVLAGLTPTIGLALRNGQLAATVRARVADVQASRRRIVSASDAERRRIERDLHDGAQQRLVSAALHLSVVRARLGDDQPAVRRAEEAVREALGRLRQLAHGIFPSVLATEGLTAALEELVFTASVPTTLEAERVEVAPETAMAAYALVGAVLERAAGGPSAPSIRVDVTRRAGDLVVRVHPLDGIALESPDLMDATDRVGAIGGSVSFERREIGGTLVAVMPCASS